jgi:protein subunit release factor B
MFVVRRSRFPCMHVVPSAPLGATAPTWVSSGVLAASLPVRAVVTVPRAEIRMSFARSSGAVRGYCHLTPQGGQNVNKVNTKAELRFSIGGVSRVPCGRRRRIG